MRTIGDVMTPAPTSIDCHEVLEDAAELMQKRHVHHLVVLDRGRIVGLLSDRDLLRFECGKHVAPEVVEVAEAMCPDPIDVTPDEPLAGVATRMADSRAGAAVVTREGRLLGIFTATDALRLLAGDERTGEVAA